MSRKYLNFCCLDWHLANDYCFLSMNLAPYQAQLIHKTTLGAGTIIICINEGIQRMNTCSKTWS